MWNIHKNHGNHYAKRTYKYAWYARVSWTGTYSNVLPVIVPGAVYFQFGDHVTAAGVYGKDAGAVTLVVVYVEDVTMDTTGGHTRTLVYVVIRYSPLVGTLGK